jgi:hypothetical protein
VPNGSTASGTVVQQYPSNGGANQQWMIVPLGNNAYKIVNHHSGKALDVMPPPGTGSWIEQNGQTCSQTQIWYFDLAFLPAF